MALLTPLAKWLIGGLAVLILLSGGLNWYLFSSLSSANQRIGALEVAAKAAAEANKGKDNATKDRARIERDVRSLDDQRLLDELRSGPKN